MGGNVIFNGISASPVSIGCQDGRDFWKAKIEHLWKTLNHCAHRKLWDESSGIEPYLAGSTKHIFDNFIPTDELIKYKNSFGDIDIQVDVEKSDILQSLLSWVEDEDFVSEFKLIGWQHTIDTIVTLWYDEDIDLYYQVDFELVEFANNRPTNWSRFSRSSSWEDTRSGIKGFAHKYIFRAITAIWLQEATVQLKTKFVTKKISPIVFSPKGARVKWREIRPNVWQEIPMDEEALVRNVEDLFKLFFKVKPDQEATCEMYSYQGVVNLILTWIDKEHHQKIADGMHNLLWGPNAQKLYRDNAPRDYYEKGVAYLNLVETLGLPIEPYLGVGKYYEKY
ncbi:hypothetical protein [Xanthomonas phage BUDD]|nr:hypothetical protein [Xanthomonas phage BUDD]